MVEALNSPLQPVTCRLKPHHSLPQFGYEDGIKISRKTVEASASLRKQSTWKTVEHRITPANLRNRTRKKALRAKPAAPVQNPSYWTVKARVWLTTFPEPSIT